MLNPLYPQKEMTKAEAVKRINSAAAIAILVAAFIVFITIQSLVSDIETFTFTIYRALFLLGVTAITIAAFALVKKSRLAAATLVFVQALYIVNLTLYSPSLNLYLVNFGILYIYIQAARATFAFRKIENTNLNNSGDGQT